MMDGWVDNTRVFSVPDQINVVASIKQLLNYRYWYLAALV